MKQQSPHLKLVGSFNIEPKFAVSILQVDHPMLFVKSIELPLAVMPVTILSPKRRPAADFRKHFTVTPKLSEALIFESETAAMLTSFDIYEFGIEADIYPVPSE